MLTSTTTTDLLMIAMLCIGMALYEVRDNSSAVVAVASMLIKFAAIPIMTHYKVDIYIVGIVALVPLTRLVEYAKSSLDKKHHDNNRHASDHTRRERRDLSDDV